MTASSTLTARIGPVGVWLGIPLGGADAASARRLAAQVERLGYSTLWFGETPGYREAFTHAGILLAATRRLVLATGIANIRLRDPLATSAAADTLDEAYPGRFVLGLGTSHPAALLGRDERHDKPLSLMRTYVDALDAAPDRLDTAPPPRVLAALRPAMQELGRDRASGIHTFCVPPEHTAAARERLGPDVAIIPEQAVVVDPVPSRARDIARAHVRTRLALPNYVRSFRALGFGDADLADGGSDRMVDSLVAQGDPDAIVARLHEHRDAGADHVAVHPLGEDLGQVAAELRDIAEALALPH